MQNVDCRRPYVFPGATLNAVIVPYQYVGTHDTLERSQAAQRLGLILQREVLHSLLAYNGIAAVQLIKPSGGATCDADIIAAQLLGRAPGAESHVGPGQSLVVLSGILYEEGADLYIRSFLRLYRNKPGGDEITVKLGERRLSAPSSVEAVAFPPVHLSSSDLQRIESQFRTASRVYKERDTASRAVEIPFDPRYPFAYTVVESSGGWTRIREMDGSITGWIQEARADAANLLQNRMLELKFLVAAAGYLLSDTSRPAGVTARRKIDEVLRVTTDPEVKASALALSAQLRLRHEVTVDEYKVAVQEVEQAFAQDPASARLRNFAASCRAWLLFKNAGSYNPHQIASDMKDAAARSSDVRMLHNLNSWYETMLASTVMKPEDPAAIQGELQAVRKILAAAR
jgi:hypothetical protein